MADLSKLSNDELMALAAQREQQRRKISSMTDDELRAASYQQPKPPPGVTIHTQSGPVFIDQSGKPQKSTMAEAEARMFRERDGIGGDVADSVLRGVPYAGAFFPRARAAWSSGDYAQNLEREQARAKTFDQDYPVASLGGKVVGGVLGTVAAAPVPYVRGAFGLGGNSALGSMAYGGAAGLAQGAAQGAGESTDLTNRNDVAKNAGISGAFGAALGAAIPGAIAGGVSAKDWFAGKMNPDTLSQIPAAASRFLTGQFDDPARVAQMRAEMQRLGPGVVLADASPEMQGIAGGAATRPGSRSTIIDALSGRDSGKNARIQSALDAELGPAPVPSRIQAGIEEGQQALGPLYGNAFQNATRVDSTGLANTLDANVANLRGPAQRSVRQVRDMLNVPGTDQLDPNPSALFQTRQAIDGILATEQNPQAIRQLTMARQNVDRELARAVPGVKDIDAQFQELARQREALQRGSQVLDTGKTAVRPGELAQEMADNANPAGTLVGPSASNVRLREGARAEIDRIVGTNSNDVAKLNQVLKSEGDWNRDKLRTLFGQDRADRLFNVLDRERVFENTFRRTTGNSETASRQSFGKLLDAIATPARPDASRTMFGTVVELGKKGVDRVRGAQGEEQAARIAKALARVSVSEGPQADALIQALMTRSGRAQTNKAIFGASGAAGPQMSPILEAIAYDLYRDDKRKAQR
jgi:hypothetical protein